MAFGHHKLIVGKDLSAGQATSYLAEPQSTGDYYSESDHAFMRWVASAQTREALGLHDSVELWKVESLMNGQHPISRNLIRQWGPNRTMVGGHDITLSPASKSVSVLWALADKDLRDELEIMTGQAADSAIGGMLKYVPLIRERYGPGPNDVRHIVAENYVGVQAFHTTARRTEAKPGTPDPDLHLHTVMFGALDRKGQLKAIDSLKIRQHRSEIDGEAMARLAEMLRLEGFEIERKLVRGRGPGEKVSKPETWTGEVKYVSYEIAGIPQSLLDAMSARTKEIADLKLKYKQEFGREAEGPGWERYVVKHRGPKSTKSSEQLRADWEAEAVEHGITPDVIAKLKAEAAARKAAGIAERGQQSPEAQQLREEILADLTRTHAIVPHRELDKLAMQRSVGLLDPNVARFVVADMVRDGDVLVSKDQTRVTTLATLALEQRTIRAAQELLDREASEAADPAMVDDEIRRQADSGNPFDEAQERSIRIAVSGAHFVSISGPAGTGKGYASRSMVNVWHAQGRRVIALAIAGRTSVQAQVDSGADEQYTLAGLETRLEHVPNFGLKKSDVLLIDEAAMLDHGRYPPVLEAADQVGATVVQVGDDKQLSPVEAGGLWTVAHRMAAEHGNTAELVTVRRARNPEEAQAWTDLREGRVQEALTWYADQGHLHLYDTRPQMIHGIVDTWFDRDAEDRGVMVIDTTNEERDMANRLAQSKLLEAGELGDQTMQLENGREIRVGDSILFGELPTHLNRDINSYGKRIENGTVATVLQLQTAGIEYRGTQLGSERGMKASSLIEREGAHQYDSERKAAEPGPPDVAVVMLHEPTGDRIVNVDASIPASLAYARHVYASQGMSAEATQAGTGEATSLENMYVMASRSRGGTDIHALRSEVEDLGASADQLDARRAEATVQAPEPQPVEATAEQATERAKVEADLAQIRERLSRPNDYHPAAREIDLDWAAHLEQMLNGAQPEVVAGAEVREPPTVHTAQLPDRAKPWTEVNAEINADRAQRDDRAASDWDRARREQTIRDIADKTKSQAKQAVATSGAEWEQPEGQKPLEAGEKQGREVRDHAQRPLYREDHRFNDRQHAEHIANRETSAVMSHKPSDTEIRQQARDRMNARAGEIAEAAAEEARATARNPVPAIMPARLGAETIARGWLREGRTAEGLGLYESRGQLRMVDNPELQAAQTAAATGGLVIAQDKEAQARIQRHVNDLRPSEGQPGSQPFPAAQDKPTGLQEKAQVITADEAYRARAEHREAWTQKTRAAQAATGQPEAIGHLVEPGAIERATVVVSDPKDAHSLVRGSSAAAEAHLVTGRPDPATGYKITQESERFAAQQREAAQTESQRQAAEAKAQAERTAQQRSQERTATHSTADHQAQAQGDPGQHSSAPSATHTPQAQASQPTAQHQEASR